MKTFTDERGRNWVATAIEEDTPRHHGRWYLVFHAEEAAGTVYPVPEIRWQNAQTAARTLRTMSDAELRRRLNSALLREMAEPAEANLAGAKAPRAETSLNAG